MYSKCHVLDLVSQLCFVRLKVGSLSTRPTQLTKNTVSFYVVCLSYTGCRKQYLLILDLYIHRRRFTAEQFF